MFVKLGVTQLNLYLEISTSVILLEILGVPGAPENTIALIGIHHPLQCEVNLTNL